MPAPPTSTVHLITWLCVIPPSMPRQPRNLGRTVLTGVEVRSSPLSSTRKIVDVVFAYTNRNTNFTEKFCVRVDVTEEFPFLVTKLSPQLQSVTQSKR